MSPQRTQEGRVLAVATPLGDDALLLDAISGHEALARPFAYELDLVSNDKSIDVNKILGENITVRIQVSTDEERHVNGFVSRFAEAGLRRGLNTYHATIVPWLWFLTRASDCRIYQDTTVPDVLKDVFQRHGFSDYELRLGDSYRTWEYIVQYRETDFAFVSRLMEQEGIYYYFTHENGKHTMVLTDPASAHDPLPGDPIPFFPPQQGESSRGPHVWSWHVERSVQPGAVALTDYNFTEPTAQMYAKAVRRRDHAASAYEMFDYPGEYAKYDEGERYAGVRADALQARHETIHATGNVRHLVPGMTFKISDEMSYLSEGQPDRTYLPTSIAIRVTEPEDFAGDDEPEADPFSVSLTAMPTDQAFRPPRSTPKPVVQGPQTAVVVGPDGEEIHTDEYGRIKVHFHWDRHAGDLAAASCWIRVAQSIAGKQWGGLITPRIGQEVIVEHLEGDPDRPLVTGAVYNDANRPPYEPKSKPTVSCLKSNSSKGGGGFNEIRIEDKAGEEQIFVHAQKNMDVRVLNNAFETVGVNAHLVVGKDKHEKVKNDRHEIIERDHVEKIARDRHVKVAGKEALAVDGDHSLTVKGDVAEEFKSNHSEKVTKDYYLKAKNVVIEASTNITLKVGSTSIAIENGGIKITGPQVAVEAKAKADVKSPMTTVEGSGMLTVKGGVVMIN